MWVSLGEEMGKLLGIPQQGQPGELTVSQSGPSSYDRGSGGRGVCAWVRETWSHPGCWQWLGEMED